MNELRTPWPRTATNVISASPIITAAAVEAVRAGFRTAFSRASLPAVPPNRAPGAPRTKASGRTTRDATIATATNSNSTPATSERIRTLMSRPCANRPYEKSATATTTMAADAGTA